MVKARRNILLIALAGLLALSLASLVSCSNEEQYQDAKEVTQEESKLRTIGTPSDDAMELEITNLTGKDIVGFAVKESSDADYGNSLVSASAKIENNEEVLAHIEPFQGSESESDSGSTKEEQNPTSDVLLRTLHNIQLTFDDESINELHDLNIEDLKSIKIFLTEEGLAYVEYESDNGDTGSTLESEQAIKEAADQAEADALVAAEAVVIDSNSSVLQNEGIDQNSSYVEQSTSNYDYSYNNSSGGASTGGSQSEDVCVDDIVLR